MEKRTENNTKSRKDYIKYQKSISSFGLASEEISNIKPKTLIKKMTPRK